MRETLRVDPKDSSPIWRQIEEGIRRLVLSRALPVGEAVPSVRDLARDLRVNPATVAKAYQRLADEGILITRRGEGTFVSESAPALRTRDRKPMLLEAAMRYASLSLSSGASLDEAEEALGRAWKQLDGKAKEESK